jgi:hypothetical protein
MICRPLNTVFIAVCAAHFGAVVVSWTETHHVCGVLLALRQMLMWPLWTL